MSSRRSLACRFGFWFRLCSLLALSALAAWQLPVTNAARSAHHTSVTLAPSFAGAALATGREAHSATLLPDGKLLVAGGRNPRSGDASGALKTTELYDPATGRWTEVGTLNTPRFDHTAALLRDGKVLVVGGRNSGGLLDSTEIYDPGKRTWTLLSARLVRPKAKATATLLPVSSLATSNLLLLTGGEDSGGATRQTELYDPINQKWFSTGSLNQARYDHTATLLLNGSVLVVNGTADGSKSLSSAELYDPKTGKWALTSNKPIIARHQHTATLLGDGSVLIAAGSENTNASNLAEIYNPSKQTWALTGSKLNFARRQHTATLLPNGQVFVAGGLDAGSAAHKTTELYDPATQRWTNGIGLTEARYNQTATILANARVLLVGGSANSTTQLTSTDIFDPAQGSWSYATNPTTGALSLMNEGRGNHTATLLTNGKVLVAGGALASSLSSSSAGVTTKTAELFDPATGQWQTTGDMRIERESHTATLLPNGKVLVVGGVNNNSYLNTAEVYDPATGAWSYTTNVLSTIRYHHTATLLPSGRVLVTGGLSLVELGLTTTDIYDPATNSWSRGPDMKVGRQEHSATLLPSGQVLVAGGAAAAAVTTALSSAEVLTMTGAISGVWETVGSMNVPRFGHSATLLPNGQALVANGPRGGALSNANNFVGTAELYDPASKTWRRTTGNPSFSYEHTATLLPNGKVMLAGGLIYVNAALSSTDVVQLFDPATDRFETTVTAAPLLVKRDFHAATLLANGSVLVTGGFLSDGAPTVSPFGTYASAEVFEVGLNNEQNAQPALGNVVWSGLDRAVCAGGVLFQGLSEASGGNEQGSASNYPLLQMRRLDNEQILYLTPDANSTQCANVLNAQANTTVSNNASATVSAEPAALFPGWSNNSFTSSPITAANFGKGPILLTVFTNGIPSGSARVLAPDAANAFPGQPPVLHLSGRVITIKGTGYPATLTLRGSNGSLKTVQTGQNGEYNFPDLPTRNVSQSLTSLSPASATAGTQSLTLSINGSGFSTNSVVLWNGNARATQFVSSQRLTATLSANDLGVPGTATVVVSHPTNGLTNALTFRVNLNGPIINALEPASARAGGASFLLTVSGQNFTTASRIYWNGSLRTTTFVSSTQLRATISANDIGAAGRAAINVLTATTGVTLTSNTVFFSILPATQPTPTPIITAFDPSAAATGSQGLTVTLVGQNFTPNSSVRWNASPRTTTYVSSTVLRVVLSAADLSKSGRYAITVANGTQISNTVFFSVTAPIGLAAAESAALAEPQQTGENITYSITPSATAGNGQPVKFEPPSANNLTTTTTNVNFLAKGAGLTIAGTISGLSSNLATVTLTLLSDDSVAPVNAMTNGSGQYTFADCYLDGDYRVTPTHSNYTFNPTVRNLTGLDDSYLAEDFAATQACPAVTNINPTSGAPGNNLTINGTGFLGVSSVVFGGNIAASSPSINGTGTQITVTVPNGAQSGPITLNKTGCSATQTQSFTVLNCPTISNVAPNAALPGATVVLTGTNFDNATAVRFNGTATSFMVVNSTTINAVVPPNATSGTVSVSKASCPDATSAVFTIQPSFEGDVMPRPTGNGNGSVTISDWVQIGLFVANPGGVASGSEFQRADCAPRETMGNGVISVSDWVQAGRFAAGLDPVSGAGGPAAAASVSLRPSRVSPSADRVQKIAAVAESYQPSVISLTTETDAQTNARWISVWWETTGGENALGFSVALTRIGWRVAAVEKGVAAESAIFRTSDATSLREGRVGIALALPPGQSWPVGKHQVARIQVLPNKSNHKGEKSAPALAFGDAPIVREVVDVQARVRLARFAVNAANQPLTANIQFGRSPRRKRETNASLPVSPMPTLVRLAHNTSSPVQTGRGAFAPNFSQRRVALVHATIERRPHVDNTQRARALRARHLDNLAIRGGPVRLWPLLRPIR